MPVYLYSKSEVDKIRKSADVLKEVFKRLEDFIKPGITTKDIDKFVENIIISLSAIPAEKNYHKYPASVCASVNEVVVHGIPNDRVLKEGDIVSIDVVALKDGFHSDACRTYPVGEISAEAKRLITVTKEAFFKGVEKARVGCRLGDISHAIQTHVENAGFGVVRDFHGHGVGRYMHEDPTIPNFGKANRGLRLKPGMSLAIEPMVTYGNYNVKTLKDGWTTVTLDNSLAAHYENTVVTTLGDPEILTL